MDRKEKIKALYSATSKSRVHREYRDRISFMRGWSRQRIAATLKKACAYAVDHPDIDFSKIYAQAFGLGINGKVPSVASF